jgi:hypothetical protein
MFVHLTIIAKSLPIAFWIELEHPFIKQIGSLLDEPVHDAARFIVASSTVALHKAYKYEVVDSVSFTNTNVCCKQTL